MLESILIHLVESQTVFSKMHLLKPTLRTTTLLLVKCASWGGIDRRWVARSSG